MLILENPLELTKQSQSLLTSRLIHEKQLFRQDHRKRIIWFQTKKLFFAVVKIWDPNDYHRL